MSDERRGTQRLRRRWEACATSSKLPRISDVLAAMDEDERVNCFMLRRDPMLSRSVFIFSGRALGEVFGSSLVGQTLDGIGRVDLAHSLGSACARALREGGEVEREGTYSSGQDIHQFRLIVLPVAGDRQVDNDPEYLVGSVTWRTRTGAR